MGTAVIPGRDMSSALQPAECIFNKVSLLIQRLAKGKCSISGSSGGYADCHPLGSQGFPQPARVITSVCWKRADIGKKVLENGRTLTVADLPFSQQKQDGPPMPATNDMEFLELVAFIGWNVPNYQGVLLRDTEDRPAITMAR